MTITKLTISWPVSAAGFVIAEYCCLPMPTALRSAYDGGVLNPSSLKIPIAACSGDTSGISFCSEHCRRSNFWLDSCSPLSAFKEKVGRN